MRNIEKIYPAQMCVEIAEKVNGAKKVYVTSPTKYGYINTKTKGIFGVQRMNGSEMKTFDTLDDAINYANTVISGDTIVRIGVRRYGKSLYSALADVYEN